MLSTTGMASAESSAFVVSTRGHFDESGNPVVLAMPYRPFDFETIGCPPEVVIYVHGVWTSSGTREDDGFALDNATEILDRARSSLDSLNYEFPIIGFSWDSDTEISPVGWENAKKIAKENGPKLAQFLIDLKDFCSLTDPPQDIKLRLIGHSLGSRVILSTLDGLAENSNWNGKLASVNLMGAAVDNDEVSKNPADVVTDSRGIKSAYGIPIEDTVLEFYNLVNVEDDVLEPGYINPWTWFNRYTFWNPFENQLVYYPFYEGDLSLGQNGIQSDILQRDRPTNYVDIFEMAEEIPNLHDANGDGNCDLINPYNGICSIAEEGDNHLGYAGFVDLSKRLVDDGAMDVVVNSWS